MKLMNNMQQMMQTVNFEQKKRDDCWMVAAEAMPGIKAVQLVLKSLRSSCC